jgi:hypothetical protein
LAAGRIDSYQGRLRSSSAQARSTERNELRTSASQGGIYRTSYYEPARLRGGIEPEQLIAVRYCESTILRSTPAAGISAFGEIYRPTGGPKPLPVICCYGTDRAKIGQWLGDICRRKFKHNFKRLTILLMNLIFVP